MGEKLPVITAGQLRRALLRAGWTEVRQRGSHVRVERGKVSITIAEHGAHPIGRGLLATILKAAGMSRDELRRLL